MSGSSVALDASAAIVLLSGQAGTLLSRSFERVLLPAPVVGEPRDGALNSRRVAENLASVERLVARYHVLDITAAAAVVYANLRLALKEQGKPIPENDLWIAALWVEHQVPLVAIDGHVDAIRELGREELQDGEPPVVTDQSGFGALYARIQD